MWPPKCCNKRSLKHPFQRNVPFEITLTMLKLMDALQLMYKKILSPSFSSLTGCIWSSGSPPCLRPKPIWPHVWIPGCSHELLPAEANVTNAERGLTDCNQLLAAALKSESLLPTVWDVACQVFIMTVFSQFLNSKPAQHAYSTLSTSTLVNVNKIHFHRFVCPVFLYTCSKNQ